MFSLKTIISLLFTTSFVFAHGDHDHDHDHEDDGHGDVVVLTDATFKEFIGKNDLSLIEFYAPWCGHCKSLKPEYEVAATKLLKKVPLAKVDCTVEKETCEAHGIQGFPTLKIFRNSNPSDYKGQRTAAAIVEVMEKQLSPAFTVVKADKIDSYIASAKVVVLGYFTASASKDRTLFEQIAQNLRDDYTFGIVEDEKVLKKEGVKGHKMIMYKKFDEPKIDYSGDFTKEAIVEFLETKSIPIMDDLGPQNYEKLVKKGLPMAYFFFGSPEHRAEYGPGFETIAKKHLGKIIFVYIDAVQFGGHAESLGLEQEWPAFGIHLSSKNEKFPYTGEFKIKEIESFVEKFSKGDIEATFKSQPVPESNDGPVTVLVGKTFEEIVMNKEKDVLVEFYAPWCGHCKKLSPIWDELGEKVESENIVIAKIDASNNDVPGVAIQGFPTIILFKANDNAQVSFEGDRTADGFLDFLSKNAVYGSEIATSDDASDKKDEEEASDEL